MLHPALKNLVCPRSHAPLLDFSEEGFLFCPTSKLRYPVVDGLPVMLVEEATTVSDDDARALQARSK